MEIVENVTAVGFFLLVVLGPYVLICLVLPMALGEVTREGVRAARAATKRKREV